MAKVQQANEYLQIKQSTDRDVRQLGVLANGRYEVESTASQTVINLNFSVTQTDDQKRGFQLFIDGQLLREGAANDFSFTAISGGVSAQVTLNAPIAAGLNIVALKIGGYQDMFPNPSSVTATLLNDVAQPHKMAQAAFQSFVAKTFVAAPNTQIVNRALIEAGALKAIGGIERVMTRGITLLNTEFGPTGQQVFEPSSKDSRIRFVGDWISSSSAYGPRIYTAAANSYVEVSFYGTGLNLIHNLYSSTPNVVYSIDGGADSSNIIPASVSDILGGRSYGKNVLANIANSLSLGWHTVKIKLVSGANLEVFGFEILSERTTLGVLSGTAFAGMKEEILSSLSSTSFNSGVVGTRGARVVKYLKDGAISQVVTEVNSASAFGSSADHTNEEAIRKISGREFGVQRTDDFSTLAGTDSTRAFTLEDGTTTLVISSGKYNNDYTADSLHTASAGFMTITFVGTGLDLITRGDSLAKSYTVSIDGSATVATLTFQTPTNYFDQKMTVCSGLPYGTHTVKLTNSAGTRGFGISDFIIYGPKKPTLPSGAVELTDFNVMANFVANTVAGLETISTGTLRKFNTRENTYINGSGTWAISSVPTPTVSSAFQVDTGSLTTSHKIRRTFFGTGFDMRFLGATNNGTNNVTLNGTAATVANFPTITAATTGSGASFNTATGVLTQTTSSAINGVGVSVYNLPLNHYTLEITQASSSVMRVDSFDIITPIHINNTRVGSLSNKDSRAFSPLTDKPNVVDLSKAKAWLVFDGINNAILANFGIAAVLPVSAGNYRVYFEKPFKTKNYVFNGNSQNTGRIISVSDRNPSFINIIATTENASVENNIVSVSFYGELEDEGEI